MSYTVKFSDGTEIPVITVLKSTAYVQGAHRVTLEIQMAKDTTTLAALDTLTADAGKTASITITDGSGSYVYSNYSLRAELAIKPVMVTPATDTAAEVDEDRLCVILAQLTYAEVQLAAQAQTINALGQQVVALSLGG